MTKIKTKIIQKKKSDNLYGFVSASNYSSFCSEIQDDLLVATFEPLSQDAFEDMPEPLSQDTPEPLSQDTPNVLRSALIELDQNVHTSQIEMQVGLENEGKTQKQKYKEPLEKLLTGNTFNNCTFNFES
ncbi:6317_t:CDS:1 [Racocetra fulgida]|uniref:6317_t:CDS:1 n=1 Tax=Racocetra fulgida TaxID=60492 RepID=A0A9N9DHB6_9GLOM|nr:6317_t:CDS:1 [Racocetra fulgida]